MGRRECVRVRRLLILAASAASCVCAWKGAYLLVDNVIHGFSRLSPLLGVLGLAWMMGLLADCLLEGDRGGTADEIAPRGLPAMREFGNGRRAARDNGTQQPVKGGEKSEQSTEIDPANGAGRNSGAGGLRNDADH
ncbi:MAG: hypothetical protein HFH28_08240 [Clostridiaceae bacterium]|nr:hypothetical protein [Clostridiaceae bacterium]